METFRKTILDGLITVSALVLVAILGQVRPMPAPIITPVTVNLVGQAANRDVQIVVYSTTWCQHCKPYLAEIEKELPKAGYVLKDRKDKDWQTAHVVIDKSENQQRLDADGVTAFPTTLIKVKGKIVKRWIGRVDLDELVKAYNDAGKASSKK